MPVLTLDEAVAWRRHLKAAGKRLVFTNGVFDLLHRGHAEYLADARRLGDGLIVGINGDASVRRLKGPTRPLVPEADRALLIAALRVVDAAVIFESDTPAELIAALVPDILVKGGDWPIAEIVGRAVVQAAGGEVRTIPLTPDRSSTDLIGTILARHGLDPASASARGTQRRRDEPT